MSKKSLKELRIAAEEVLTAGVANKAQLIAALPILIDIQKAIANASETAKQCGQLARKLSEACARYGLDHVSIFDEGLQLSPIGVKSGNITIDDETYHFASGYDKPKRIDGQNTTQAFLKGLPEGWTKSKLELDVSGINQMGVKDEALEAKGLYRPEKNEWSIK